MKKTVYLTILLALLVIFFSQTGTTQDRDPGINAEYFPLKEGRFWQYNYSSEEQAMADAEGEAIIKTEAEIKLKITNIIETSKVILAEVSGNSLNLFDCTKDAHTYWIAIIKSTGCFYCNQPFSKEDFLDERLDGPKGEPTLMMPLRVGQYWNDQGLKRKDTSYRWQVEAMETITVPAGTFKCFRIAYRSCPDHQIIWFCPTVGIIRQEYEHHGTIINFYMELAAYGSEK
jgi:hypothetical protein